MWIKKFLIDRKQSVVMEGECSYKASVSSGVPQGSLLGPCLFLFYINDISEQLRAKIRLYADLHDELSTAVIGDNLSDVVKLYERTLLHLLDKHAPEKHRVITIRHT